MPTLLEACKAKGYKVFEHGKFNLNIIGERSVPGVENSFDDVLHCIYIDDSDTQVHKRWAITTDPGRYWIDHPERREGTGILCPGQYRGCWTFGLHKGQYECLTQTKENVFKCWRRADGHMVYGGQVYDDATGVQCHHAGNHSTQVDKWSMLCQVFANIADFQEFMSICHKQEEHGMGKTFTYTLIESTDVHP